MRAKRGAGAAPRALARTPIPELSRTGQGIAPSPPEREAGDVLESGLATRKLAHRGIDAPDPLGGACAVAWRKEIEQPLRSELARLGVFRFSGAVNVGSKKALAATALEEVSVAPIRPARCSRQCSRQSSMFPPPLGGGRSRIYAYVTCLGIYAYGRQNGRRNTVALS
jgi:hypothetical protein